MNFKSRLCGAVLSIMAAGLFSTAVQAATLDAAKAEGVFTEAMSQYKRGQWSGAYGRFAALADQGHLEAARIALFMLSHGAAMYGSEWGASQVQINQWTKLTARKVETVQSASGD